MTLDKILRDEERLRMGGGTIGDLRRFYFLHGPRLAAVARAAVAWRAAEAASDGVRPTCRDTDLFQRLIDRRRATRDAFDAAAGGKP